MNKLFFIAVSLTLIFLTGCGSTVYNADYKILLSQVERPMEAVNIAGEPNLIDWFNSDKYKYCFEDSLVKIFWFVNSKEIDFLLENKTDYTIKLPWDQASFVDGEGFSHHVIHSTIDFNDKEKPQPPSVIPRKCKFEDSITPADYIKLVENGGEQSYSYWKADSFLPDSYVQKYKDDQTKNLDIFTDKVKQNIGKDIQVLLPIEYRGNTFGYIFTFRIQDVAVTKQ